MSKIKNLQKKFRQTIFPSSQYWNINYTEHLPDGSQVDYKTFIKAKSYVEAKRVLQKRLSCQNPPTVAKAIQGFMFHKGYKSKTNIRLGLKEWEQIRAASFPNPNDVLYKLEVPRDPDKNNRFNRTDYEHLSKIGFKKGKENWSHIHRKGVSLPPEEREGMIYSGKWIKWDKDAMKATRQSIIAALVKSGGSRVKAAEDLGINRNQLYNLMSKFPSINWKKDYPAKKPVPPKIDSKVRSELQKKTMKKRMSEGFIPFQYGEDTEKRRVNSLKKFRKEKRQKYISEIVPKIKEALELFSNHRTKAAEHLGMKPGTLWKLMRETRNIVNWPAEYPSKKSRYSRLFPADYPKRPDNVIKRTNKLNNL